MKIQSIAGAKHPILRKGEAVELTPEQKVCVQAKEEFVKISKGEFLIIPLSAKVLGTVKIIQGRQTKKNSEPTQYMAKVELTYRKLRESDDRLFSSKVTEVSIHCKDSTDEIGAPDLQTVEFSIKEKAVH